MLEWWLDPLPPSSETLNPFLRATVLRRLRHPFIVEFKGVGAMHNDSAAAMRRSMFLVQVGRHPCLPCNVQSCGRGATREAGRLRAAVPLRAERFDRARRGWS